MRKKQAFAVLLAACMTISCIPATAYASVAEPGQVSEFGDQIDDAGEPSGENGGDLSPSPTVTETPPVTETPAETEEPKEEPTETPEAPEAEEPASQNVLKETDPTDPSDETPKEDTTKENVVFIGETGYKTLAEAITAAAATAEKKADILLKGDLEIAQTVEIPADVTVTITAEKDVKITRAAAATGSTFKVAEKGSLTLKKGEGNGSIAVTGAAKADSPLFQVEGKLFITDGVSIKGNESKGTAGAVFNKGTFTMTGGTISGNVCDNGAVYNEGTFEVSGNVDISGNLKADKKTKSNVTLANKGVVTVTGKLDEKAKIGLHAAKAENGLTVVKAGKDVKLEENLAKFTYDIEDGTKINSAGALEDVPEEPVKDVTAPVLQEISAERSSQEEAVVTFRSDEAGTYYVSIDEPDVDTSGKGNKLSENVDTAYRIDGLSKGEHTAYIVAVDAAGNVSNPLAITIPTLEEPKIADKANNTINGIADSYDKNYYLSSRKEYRYYVSFTATGAGMEFPDEVGNVRYEPYEWYIGGEKHDMSAANGYKGSFTASAKAGTYELLVRFKQQEYNGTEWQETGEIDTKTAKIVLNPAKETPTPTKKPTTGGTSNTKKTTTGNNSSNNKASSVSTGDETNAVPIIFLGGSAAALAAAMIVMKKKRSEEDE